MACDSSAEPRRKYTEPLKEKENTQILGIDVKYVQKNSPDTHFHLCMTGTGLDYH